MSGSVRCYSCSLWCHIADGGDDGEGLGVYSVTLANIFTVHLFSHFSLFATDYFYVANLEEKLHF